jgi:hypothetical protein
MSEEINMMRLVICITVSSPAVCALPLAGRRRS